MFSDLFTSHTDGIARSERKLGLCIRTRLLLYGCSVVTRGRGADRPGWHPPGGPKENFFLWANLQRIVEKRDRTGEKGVGWHPRGGDTRVKAIKSDKAMSKKGRQFLRRRNQGWHRRTGDWKKGCQVFREKIEGWHPQSPPRVSPTLVTPLYGCWCMLSRSLSEESQVWG